MPKTKPLPDLCQYDKAECAPKSKASKDKRHWCRGKVGVRHKVKWVIVNRYIGKHPQLVCAQCDKVLDWHFKPWVKQNESDADYDKRCAKAWEDKQIEAKRRLAYYLDFVD